MSVNPPVDFEERARRVLGTRKRRTPGDAAQEKETELKATAATKMVDLLLQLKHELWHNPAGEPFATFLDNRIRRHYAVNGSDFQKLAQRLNYLEYGTAPAADAVKAALNVIAAEAEYAGVEYPIFSRIAHHEGEVWIDLGDHSWRAVRISSALLPIGWEVVDSMDVPIRFRRNPSAKPLPLPEDGGSLETLRKIFPNIGDDDWIMLVGWLVGCFQQAGGRAFLELLGGQGSGKSTLGRYLLSLIDPNQASLRSLPKHEQDLLISVSGRIGAGFDNLSVIMPEAADALCRISTGAGISNRMLYTNSEEVVLTAQLSLLWTAIEPQAIRRADLQDRTITIRLDGIEESARYSEREIATVEEEMRPQHLGALYRAIATALGRQDTIHLDRLPRLADFAVWVEAAGPAFAWDEGRFVDALESSRAIASALAVDAAPIGPLLIEFMRTRSHWEGTAGDLLAELKGMADDDLKRSRSFPKDATRLSGQLRRLMQPLRAVGVWVGFDRTSRSRGVIIDRNDEVCARDVPPEPKHASASPTELAQASLKSEGLCARCGGDLEPGQSRLCRTCTGKVVA